MSVESANHDHERMSVMLQSQEKGRRISVLKGILKTFEVECSEDELLKSWTILNRPLAKMLSDPAEICREQAVEAMRHYLMALSPDDRHIMYLLPTLSRRLGSEEYVETSEEVRLKCVSLLRMIISKYQSHLSVYVEDVIKILARAVADSYPLVKRESCECLSEFAKTLPTHFYAHSETLVQPVLSNFAHQHYRVRIASIKAIGDLVQYGNNKSVEVVALPLAEKLFDQSSLVRAAVIEVAGRWLVELRDRYSWWHKLLPLLLTGLHDEIEEIREKAGILWEAAGELYMTENQDDERFKDKMDYLVQDPLHYPKLRRPNLGCRVIAQQNLSKLINGIVRELDDWLPDVRVRSAQLLCVLILNVEEDVTQHIEKLLPAMYRAGNNEDKRVVENIEKAAEYIGYFVHPEIYCRLVLPTLEETLSPGHMRVFSAILRCSERSTLFPFLQEIGSFLRQSHVCQSRKKAYQEQIMSCSNSLLLVAEKDCIIISEDLFIVIYTTLSMATDIAIQSEAERLLDVLSSVSLKNINEFYCSYMRSLISSFHDCKSWSVHSAESQIFCTYLTRADTTIASNVDLVLLILKDVMAADTGPELRLKYFILLSECFTQNQQSFCEIVDLNEFLRTLLEECLLPALVWSAGRAAEAVRTAAVSCLCALLQVCTASIESAKDDSLKRTRETDARFSKETFIFIFNNVMPILVSLVDDNAKKSRLYSLYTMRSIVSVGKSLNCITEEHINKMYPVTLKKLDDGCDDVRYAALDTLVEIWSAVPTDYNIEFNRSHVDALYTTTMIYLDDPEEQFENTMLESLKKMSKVHPNLLYQKLQSSQTNFRNRAGIETLLEHCQHILSGN